MAGIQYWPRELQHLQYTSVNCMQYGGFTLRMQVQMGCRKTESPDLKLRTYETYDLRDL